jgi:hypothetical protein
VAERLKAAVVALETTQQTGPDVFTRMNWYGRNTATALDAQM